MTGSNGQPNKLTTDQIAAFMAEWLPRSISLNFSQIWLDRETGKDVDFATIADPVKLKAASDRAERQYLNEIEETRLAYVIQFPESRQKEALCEFDRELAKADLYYLSKYILGYDQEVFHLHYFMCRSMENLAEGYRGLREFPRDCFKTTCMGISFIVQQVLKNPDVRILYKSNAEGNASNKIVEAKNHFIKTAALIERFPEHHPKRKADEGSDTEWSTPCRKSVQAEATFTAAGVGSSKTSQHYDMVLGDDFWDEKSVTSPEVMAKARRELHQLQYLLAVPARGRIVFIGTRFAHDDITTDLRDNPSYHCIIASGITPAGRSLFPENMDLEHFFGQAHTAKYEFSCQIMLNPTDDARGFQREWFHYMSWPELKALELEGKIATRKVILADATADSKKGSDFVALEVVVIDSLGRMSLVEYTRAKMAPSEFIDEMFRLYDKWLPDYIVRQKTVLETTIMSFVHSRNEERGKQGLRVANFYDYSLAKREKKGRITAALQPLLQSGRLWFDRDLMNLPELEKELIEHPNSQNDDGIDALSMLDDPGVCWLPSCKAIIPPMPDQFVPVKGDLASDQIYRRQQASAAFQSVRDDGKQKNGRTRPGQVVD